MGRRASLAAPLTHCGSAHRVPEERVHLGPGAETGHAEAGELGWIALTAAGRTPKGEPKERIGAGEGLQQRLAVPVPERLAQRDAPQCPEYESREPHAPWEIEPHDRVGLGEDEIAELASIRSVDHPRLFGDKWFDTASQLGGVELEPSCLPVDRVEFRERHAEPVGERTREGGFAASACGRDDRNASHQETIRSAPPESVRCT